MRDEGHHTPPSKGLTGDEEKDARFRDGFSSSQLLKPLRVPWVHSNLADEPLFEREFSDKGRHFESWVALLAGL